MVFIIEISSILLLLLLLLLFLLLLPPLLRLLLLYLHLPLLLHGPFIRLSYPLFRFRPSRFRPMRSRVESSDGGGYGSRFRGGCGSCVSSGFMGKVVVVP